MSRPEEQTVQNYSRPNTVALKAMDNSPKKAHIHESRVCNDNLDVEKGGGTTLPGKGQHPIIRNFRHRLFGVYRRLFSVVFLLNLAGFIYICVALNTPTLSSVSSLATPVAVNFFVAALFRTEYTINFLYYLVIWVPLSLPLRIRRRLAKVYEFGGVHSGAGVGCTIWSIFFTIQISRAYIVGEPVGAASVAITYVLVALLLVIVVAAYPSIRRKHHDHFEALHRICGWVGLALFWALAMLLNEDMARLVEVDHRSFSRTLFTAPPIYFLIATTFLTILPWLRLRKIPAHAVKLSDHATRIYFPAPRVGPTQGIKISLSPILEWHAFATIPCSSSNSSSSSSSSSDDGNDDDRTQPPSSRLSERRHEYSILVSAAGDWTRAAIADPRRDRHYWQRGIPINGVAIVGNLFRRVVLVTTGSGIGPALSTMAAVGRHQKKRRRTSRTRTGVSSSSSTDLEAYPAGASNDDETIQRCRLVWSTPAPHDTYGPDVLAEVMHTDPGAVIWDTRKMGRPDMVALTWRIYREWDAEAVIVISNPRVTAQVVYGMEARGVPAYGPIFDS